MKKLLICLGLLASLLNATTEHCAMAGNELQRLIECSARDAAFQAEIEVQAALLDAINGLNQRVRDAEDNLRSVSIWTKLPSMTAAARSDMETAQMRINELERCSKDLQTCVNALAASADSNAIQASTVADLSTQVKTLESSVAAITEMSAAEKSAQAVTAARVHTQLNNLESSMDTVIRNFAQASDLEHLNMHIGKIERRLNGTMASFTQSMQALQEKMKIADATMATTNANLMALKKDVRRRM